MILQFAGLSLIVHLVIILAAVVRNYIKGESYSSAFETYGRDGGLFHCPRKNMIMSFLILLFVITYSFALMYIAVWTSLRLEEADPQIFRMYHLIEGYWMTLLMIFLMSVVVWNLNSVVRQNLRFINQIINTIRHRSNNSINMILNIKILSNLPKWVAKVGAPALVCVSIATTLFLLPLFANAQIVEPGFESEVVASGFSLATAASFAPDGRIFVAEKSGIIRVVKDGTVLQEPLITLTDVNTFGDRGLLGVAVDPNFANNGYLYLSYTYENTPGLNVAGQKTGRIVRVTVVGDIASESSKLVLVGTVGGDLSAPSCEHHALLADCITSDSGGHSVGGLRFGPDGKLYATLGDGADFGAVDTRALRAQNIDSLAGKMLRINKDGTAPADNPFYNGDPTANRSKVYAYGFRNMFRFNFNLDTGKVYGGDVGWSNWEEVNEIYPGANYGWPCREGAGPQIEYNCSPTATATDPLYTYPHNASGAGSITSGAFFTNGAYPEAYETSFFIGDYAQMWIKRMVLDVNGDLLSVEDFIDANVWPVEILTGNDGNVYYIDIATGNLMRITHTDGNRRPVVDMSASPTSGLAPLEVSFSSAGTFDPDGDALTYMWSFGTGVTSVAENPTYTYNIDGEYTVVLTVSDENGSEVSQSKDIMVGNRAPEASITTPVSGSFYLPLENVTVTGTGQDSEDGVLPDSAFEWSVILHHNTHTHTIQQFTATKTIIFVADDHFAPDVYMEIFLTVTDSVGLTNTKSINMYLNNGTTGGNLISNPSLEIPDPNVASPKDWSSGWYGTMSPTFTYPAPGLSGETSAQVTVADYVAGSAKWFFTPVFVNPGEEYTFTSIYKADTDTNLSAQFARADGTYFYQQLGSFVATSESTPINLSLTIPSETVTFTIFHELASNGTLFIDEYSLTLDEEEVDTTPPTGSITSPSNGDVISGLVPVSVTANDNTGVASVHLFVDGEELVGVEAVEEPYVLLWDTTLLTDGTYEIMAQVHDTANNVGSSTVISVEVDNSSTSTSPTNMIFNGDLEINGGAGNPLGWSPAGWGSHTRAYTYPVPGRIGGSAAEVSILEYELSDTGDAKWKFDDIAVTPGTEYTFEDYYKANTISDVIGRYTLTNGSVSYFGIVKEIVPATDWTKISNTFVPPANVESVTFFHLISSVGVLTIDDMLVFENGTGTPSELNPPVVEFTSHADGDILSGIVTLEADAIDDTSIVGVYFAVNGSPHGAEDKTPPYQVIWDTTVVADGTYILKATTHDPFGNNSKDEITVTVDNSSVATSSSLIKNPDLEIAGPTGDPLNWKRGGWGTNNRQFTYPITGESGNGARVEISSYTNGDAKWYFDDVAVVSGEMYQFSNQYRSDSPTELLVRYTLNDDSTQYQYLAGLPTAPVWTQNEIDINVPANVKSLTVFHILHGVGFLEVDSFVLSGESTPTVDNIPPEVSYVGVSDGDLVVGTLNLTVTATDDVAVSYTQLQIDGIPVMTDVNAPYTFSWDSTTVVNGVYSLTVMAEDTSNNLTVTSPISITVDNESGPVDPPATTAILNASLEIVDPSNPALPESWSQSGFGDYTSTFTYPIAGYIGSAARVEVLDYVSGDAKWVFDPVAVTADELYTWTHAYRSDVETNISMQYERSDGSVYYVGRVDLLPSIDWTVVSDSFVIPSDVVKVSIFHSLTSNGFLEIDEYGFTIGTTDGFTNGKISLTFDDGWLTHYTEAYPLLEMYDLYGTFYVVNDETLRATGDELIVNNYLLDSGVSGDPSGWKRGGWGTNDRIFTYPDTGITTNKAATVEISAYSSGDAKWYFDDVPVTAGEGYSITETYRSTIDSEMVIRYTKADSSQIYEFIEQIPSTGDQWSVYSTNVTAPADVVSATVFHVIASVGKLSIDTVSMVKTEDFASVELVNKLTEGGHEIGAHTNTHPYLTTLSASEKDSEISGSRTSLLGALQSGTAIDSLAYPYGDYDVEVIDVTTSAGYLSARSVDRGYNTKITNKYALKIQEIGRDTTIADIQNWIAQAENDNTWLIFMFHQIDDIAANTLGVTPEFFTEILDTVSESGIEVQTVNDVVQLMD